MERGDEFIGPGPPGSDAQGGGAAVRVSFAATCSCQWSVQEQVLGLAEQVDAGQGEFQPGGVDRDLLEYRRRQLAPAGGH